MASDIPFRGINRRDLLAGLAVSFAGAAGAQQSAAPQPDSTRAATSCVLTPVTSEGPFYFDPKLVRADIAEHQSGVPLTLELRVVSAGGRCSPVDKARVDVWHSNAHGIYSDYENQRGVGQAGEQTATGKTFLRGTQLTDSDGVTRFRTIYPSWYYGRTSHIHLKVFLPPREVAVTQLFFPDAISDRVYSSSKDYVARTRGRDTYNEDDMYLRGGRTGGAFCDVVADGKGYRATVVIGIADA